MYVMITTKAVLIIGGSGFLGTNLALRLREEYKVFATYRTHRVRIPGVSFIPCNVEDRNWMKRIVYTAQPDVIIYAAGSNDVRLAEIEQRKTDHVHTGGAATVSNISDILQPKFIYISNCYAFDGSNGNYHESDVISPITALGKAKVGGENVIRGKFLNCVIIRSSPLIGRGNGINLSFIDKLRMTLAKGRQIEVASQELHSFGLIEGLVETVDRLIKTGVRNTVLHYSGLTKISFADMARIFARRFGYNPSLIVQPRTTARKTISDDYVYDYSLNSSRTVELLKIKPLLLEESFDLIEKQLIPRF
jgi:dTDP-4-dehydrorhamnose reductase